MSLVPTRVRTVGRPRARFTVASAQARSWVIALGAVVLIAPSAAAAPVDFEREILPLLQARCFSCHSEKKAKPKGDLRLDSAPAIQQSGVIAAGRPDQSELLTRISLPPDDEEHMPPSASGGQSLDADQREMLRRWIAEGANFGAWTRYAHREAPRPVRAGTTSDVAKQAREIDDRVDRHLAEQGLKPNPPASDAVFLRRVFLDLAGRIPTAEEAATFFQNPAGERRRAVIDRLLASEAYVSHTFNHWADALRLSTKLGAGQPWKYYDAWVKDAVRSGKTYDRIVSELITGEGYLWDNGAVGFYLRDRGMPLDHLANLTRVFLGTRLECAQCHDHPFEPVTQKDYYQMAAYTYGVSALNSPSGYDPKWVPHWQELQARLKEAKAPKVMQDAVSRTVAPLKRLTTDTNAELKYAEKFLGDAALRGRTVEARTLWGDEAPATLGDRRTAFARWLVSPGNPRFAPNVANRLWKRAMGAGLVEPVDSLSPFDRAAIPGLLPHLADLLVQLGFDDRRFLAVLLNTRAYQREAQRDEAANGPAVSLRGPLMRRLSAEQLWDSLLVFVVRDLDQRRSSLSYEGTSLDRDYLRALERMSVDEILARAQTEHEYLDVDRHAFARRAGEINQALARARDEGDRAGVARLRAELAEVETQDLRRRESIGLGRPRSAPETDPRWIGLPAAFLRASELESPTDFGHFLRTFGQSDRREINASTTAANLTQSLALMNGELTARVLDAGSVLRREVSAVSDGQERGAVIFRRVLGREPRSQETARWRTLRQESPTPEEDLIWALINSPEFLFTP